MNGVTHFNDHRRDQSGLREITTVAKLMALELSECNPRHIELVEILERALYKIRKGRK